MRAAGAWSPAPAGPSAARHGALLRLAARLFDVPMAAIGVIENGIVRCRASLGHVFEDHPSERSFSGVVAATLAPLVVPDTAADPRFRDLPQVLDPPRIRFFVGQPILDSAGACIGTLGIYDQVPRPGPVPAADLDMLGDLATEVGDILLRDAEARRLRGRQASLERQFRAIVEAIPLPLLTIDRDGVVTAWNPAAERVFGWTAAEAIGRFGPHVPPEQRQASRDIQAPIGRGERLVGVEVERMRKDGSRLPVAISTAPLFDATGRPDGAVVVIEDISARHLAAAEAAARAARIAGDAAVLTRIAASRHVASGDVPAAVRRILAAAAETLGGCDAALWRIDAADAAMHLLDCVEAGGQSVTPDDPRRRWLAVAPYDPAIAAERALAIEDVALGGVAVELRADRPLPALLAPLGYGAALFAPVVAAGQPEGVLAALSPGGARRWSAEDRALLASLGDLSALAMEAGRRAAAMARLQAEKNRAEAADRAKSRFLGGMSHELRTPLNAIIGFAELLRDREPTPEHRHEFANHIATAGRSLLATLTAVLDQARIEDRPLQLEEGRAEPAALIGAALLDVAAPMLSRGIAIRRSDAPMPPLRADAERLRQAIGHVLSNAIKFSPAGGRVEIGGGFDPATGYAIWVRDTGIGMRPEEIALAFEPFRQLAPGPGQTFGGTGLGLPLARAFIEAHGGRLVLDSHEGKGTLAMLTLPAERAERPGADRA